MDKKTAWKYIRQGWLLREIKKEQGWRTREYPCADEWPKVCSRMEIARELEAWRASGGPPQEVFLPQSHEPGKLSPSDFNHLEVLGIKIGGLHFDHLLYHFVLTYSNWETGRICLTGMFPKLNVL